MHVGRCATAGLLLLSPATSPNRGCVIAAPALVLPRMGFSVAIPTMMVSVTRYHGRRAA